MQTQQQHVNKSRATQNFTIGFEKDDLDDFALSRNDGVAQIAVAQT